MADKLKDKEDRTLEALFRTDAVADDGFSVKVVARVRRQIWVRRLTLPIAFLIGAMFAAQPLVEFAALLPGLVSAAPDTLLSSIDVPVGEFLQGPTLILGVLLLGATLMIGKMLED